MDLITRQPWIAAFRRQCEARGLVWSEKRLPRPSGYSKFLFISQPERLPARTIVFLHGLGDDLLFPQARLFGHLLKAGWSIASCDLDGHGQGNESLFNQQEILSLPANIIEFIDKYFPGQSKMHFMGFSLGGALLLNHAVQNPGRVLSLIMIGTPLKAPDKPSVRQLVQEFSGFFGKSFRNAMGEFRIARTIPAFGPFRRGQYPVRLKNPGTTFADEARSLIEDIAPLKKLRLARFPLLYLAGDRDWIASLRDAELAKSDASQLQTYTIPRATHLSTIHESNCWKHIEFFLNSASTK
ncbi:MAG: alpha/beta hydrolase [Proteobacteria bacterium]|nr:alpha/beta hydrolase [Pseudomonadota bacterium]